MASRFVIQQIHNKSKLWSLRYSFVNYTCRFPIIFRRRDSRRLFRRLYSRHCGRRLRGALFLGDGPASTYAVHRPKGGRSRLGLLWIRKWKPLTF